MAKDKWYDSDDPSRVARGATFFGLRWGVGLLVLLLAAGGLISAGVWLVGVGTSNVHGKGEAIKQKNTALNRTQAQAQFHSTFESIRSLDQRLTDAQATLDAFNKAHPNVGNGTVYDPLAEQQANLQRNVTGLQQQCRIAAADYNAATETYNLRDFRDSDLPFKIEESDPLFSGGQADFHDFDCAA